MNLAICVVYRQPDDSTHGHPSKNIQFRDALDKLQLCLDNLGTPTPNIILGGDFNLPHTQWPHCTPTPGCPREEREMIATLNVFSNHFCMMQIVTESTHKDGNLLDCVFINNENIFHDISVNGVLQSISHHKIIEVSTPLHTTQAVNGSEHDAPKTGFLALNFFHSDVQWEKLSDELDCVDWNSLMRDKSASSMLNIMYDISGFIVNLRNQIQGFQG